MIALSLGFTVIRVLFRFLIERIFLRVLSDRVFFESSEIESSSLGYAVIDSSLYQGSFFRHVPVFLSNRVATFFIKNRCFVLHLLWFSKIISLTCSDNFTKTNSEKNEEIHSRDTKYFIGNICHQLPDLYNQIPGEFQVQKQPPVVFFA